MKYRPILDRFMEKVELIPFHSCWEWTGQLSKSKGYAMIWDRKLGRTTVASRVSYQLFNGEIPDGLLVCHTCDNRSCVNPKHLWLGTYQNNTDDMIAKGRVATGLQQVGNRILSLEDVYSIRAEHKAGVVGFGYKAIAKRRGISAGAVRAILTKKTWWYV